MKARPAGRSATLRGLRSAATAGGQNVVAPIWNCFPFDLSGGSTLEVEAGPDADRYCGPKGFDARDRDPGNHRRHRYDRRFA